MTTFTPIFLCSLQGVITNNDFDKLLERLRGLCQPWETYFKIHEIVYKIEGAQSGASPGELRVRHTFSQHKESNETTNHWTLHFVGAPSRRADLSCLCRSSIDIEVSDNICNFLEAIGFVDEFEFLREGIRFHVIFTDHIKADITFTVKGQLESVVELETTMHHWLVEISTLSDEKTIKQTCDTLHNFANRLIPIVDLIKLDDNTKKEIDKRYQQHKTTQTSGNTTQ